MDYNMKLPYERNEAGSFAVATVDGGFKLLVCLLERPPNITDDVMKLLMPHVLAKLQKELSAVSEYLAGPPTSSMPPLKDSPVGVDAAEDALSQEKMAGYAFADLSKKGHLWMTDSMGETYPSSSITSGVQHDAGSYDPPSSAHSFQESFPELLFQQHTQDLTEPIGEIEYSIENQQDLMSFERPIRMVASTLQAPEQGALPPYIGLSSYVGQGLHARPHQVWNAPGPNATTSCNEIRRQRYSCPYGDDKSYADRRGLQRHIDAKHRGLMHACALCEKTFNRMYSLSRHCKDVHGVAIHSQEEEKYDFEQLAYGLEV